MSILAELRCPLLLTASDLCKTVIFDNDSSTRLKQAGNVKAGYFRIWNKPQTHFIHAPTKLNSTNRNETLQKIQDKRKLSPPHPVHQIARAGEWT
jgi:hypothetical protein